MLKLLHGQWLTDLYNLMTSAEGKNIVLKGWKSAYITEAVQKGLSNLSALIGPFSDIDPIINFDTVEPNVEAVIDKTADDLEMLGVETINDDDTDDDDEANIPNP